MKNHEECQWPENYLADLAAKHHAKLARKKRLTELAKTRPARPKRIANPTLQTGDLPQHKFPWRPLLTQLTDLVRRGRPFLYLRYGDGEFDSILNRPGKNKDGQSHHGKTLGRVLAKILDEAAALPANKRANVWMGGCLGREGWTQNLKKWRLYNRLVKLYKDHGWESVPWSNEWAFRNGLEDQSTLHFLQAVRDSKAPKVLVGNHRVRRMAEWLGATFVQIPDKDAFDAYDATFDACRKLASKGAVFIYACGMLAKVLAWHIFKRHRDTLHADFGHAMEPLCNPTYDEREWLNPERKKDRREPDRVRRRKGMQEIYIPAFASIHGDASPAAPTQIGCHWEWSHPCLLHFCGRPAHKQFTQAAKLANIRIDGGAWPAELEAVTFIDHKQAPGSTLIERSFANRGWPITVVRGDSKQRWINHGKLAMGAAHFSRPGPRYVLSIDATDTVMVDRADEMLRRFREHFEPAGVRLLYNAETRGWPAGGKCMEHELQFAEPFRHFNAGACIGLREAAADLFLRASRIRVPGAEQSDQASLREIWHQTPGVDIDRHGVIFRTLSQYDHERPMLEIHVSHDRPIKLPFAFPAGKGRGSIDLRHAAFMHDVLAGIEARRVLEIGSLRGVSASAILAASRPGRAHVLCEPSPTPELIRLVDRHNAQRPGSCEIAAMTSFELFRRSRGEWDVVHVDGSHKIEAVRTEADWIVRHLVPGVFAHDTRSHETEKNDDFLGVTYLMERLRAAGYMITEDAERRPCERTHLGFCFATRNSRWHEVAQRAADKWFARGTVVTW